MIGIVIISHSAKLAEGTVELVKMLAADVPIAAAGGLEDGSFGTSYDKIVAAVESVCSGDGVLLLADMGSALLTAEMVLEAMPDKKLHMPDCPLVEGALTAAMSALAGHDIDEALRQLAAPDAFRKR